jgi:hypothetical protein
MGGRVRATAGIAWTLILIGIILPALYARWLTTRTFLAFEMPASLKPGEISSTEFTVNLEGWYQIGTDVDQSFPFRFDCGFGGRPPLLKTHVSIYRDGRALEQSDGADRFLGHFHAEPGERYRFDLEILTDASCLNSGHPRIFVWTDSRYYEYLQHFVWIVSAVLLLWGVGLLFFSITGRLFVRAEPQSELHISEGTGPYFPRQRARPLKPRFTRMPSFGLLCTMTLGAVLLPSFLIYLCVWGYDRPSVGVRVHLVRPSLSRSAGTFRPSRVLLRVECTRFDTLPRLYLNSRPVRSGSLPDALKFELKSHAEWIVYVEGNSRCTWEDVANAIDIIRTSGAQVVLSTANLPRSDTARSDK